MLNTSLCIFLRNIKLLTTVYYHFMFNISVMNRMISSSTTGSTLLLSGTTFFRDNLYWIIFNIPLTKI